MSKTIIFLVLLTMILNSSFSQGRRLDSTPENKDSLHILTKFMRLCNSYKKVPLLVDLQYSLATNYLTSDDDTAGIYAKFYSLEHGAYLRFGELEQIVDDSTALLVSDKLKRMFLYTDAKVVINKMRSMMGSPVSDSSIRNLFINFSVSEAPLNHEFGSIELTSRKSIPATDFPKEIITLAYDRKSENPLRIVQLKRTLITLDQKKYDSLKAVTQFHEKLLEIEGNFYLIKENTYSFIYTKIEHNGGIRLPVTIEDRIVKNQSGKYVPVRKFENFILTKN